MKRNEKANFNLKKETGFTGIFDYYISFDCFSWHGPIVGLSDAWNNFRSISVVLAYDKNCHVQVGQLAIHVYPFFNWLFFSSMASLLLGRRVNSTAKSFSFLIVRPQTFTFTRATSRWTVIGHKFTWSLPSLICSIFFTGKWFKVDKFRNDLFKFAFLSLPITFLFRLMKRERLNVNYYIFYRWELAYNNQVIRNVNKVKKDVTVNQRPSHS